MQEGLRRFVAGRSPRFWTGAAIAAFAALTGIALGFYGGMPYFPALATEFGASLAAFVLALEWEAYRERAAIVRSANETTRARKTEARKRLLSLQKELERNEVSIKLLADKVPAVASGSVEELLHPELLDGAWSTSGERLGGLLADYELVGKLATFYGRLEELRWRIRYRTQAKDSYLDPPTKKLAAEMQDEVKELLESVEKEGKDPDVRLIGVSYIELGAVIVGRGRLTSAQG